MLGANMKKELLFSITKKDFKIEYFSGTGAGGQHRNKHQNCVRIHHPESGVVVTGQSNRERISNLREAFKNMVNDPKFKVWHNRKIQEILSGKNIETIVEKQMSPENIKVEIKENEKWVESV
jgi:peptide chain release factor 1